MIYVIASYHDIGKFENHEIHEIISAQKFLADEKIKTFFKEDVETPTLKTKNIELEDVFYAFFKNNNIFIIKHSDLI